MKNEKFVPIAVVGIGTLFPGATDKSTFWNNIIEGKDFIEEIPKGHWLIEDYCDKEAAFDTTKEAKTYVKRGGFIPSVEFDPLEFGIPPKALSTTDTAQLLSLIVAKQVIEDAHSIQFQKLDKSRISVILGVTSSTELVCEMASKIQKPVWQRVLRENGLPESQVQDICEKLYNSYVDWDESTFPGLLGNVVAGRIANRFDFGGTNCVVDAACGSSHAAINLAIKELQLKSSDLVITGGADALNNIFMYMCFTRTPALSKTDDCRPFSSDADGTMLGEGIGMLALRRLEDAEKDNDKIYAVIRGVGSSSDGKDKSVYAPSSDGQARCIINAYQNAGYEFDDVELVEAHGTATSAGDVAEFEGMKKAMSHNNSTNSAKCALGSIKSQIGHTKAAAGSAALIKAVMAVHHKVLPPTIKVSEPNPKLEIDKSKFYLNTNTRPWIHSEASTRKAGISAFGFGGSNFHITLEEYTNKDNRAKRVLNFPIQLLLFSSDTIDGLFNQVQKEIDLLEEAAIETVSKRLQTKFEPTFDKRLALLVSSKHELPSLLNTAKNKIMLSPKENFSISGKLHYGVGDCEKGLAFLFPGQGSQYLNMGSDLAIQLDSVRTVWDRTAGIEFGVEKKLHEIVFPIPVFNEQNKKVQIEELKKTEWAQPAIGAMSASLLEILKELGVKADFIAGHSYGEVTALYEAGVIGSLEDLIKISRTRGELMAKAAKQDGAMTAVQASEELVRQILDESKQEVCIANVNSPSQVVISGETAGVIFVENVLDSRRISYKRLPVATAFHSKVVEQSAEPFYEFLKTIELHAPQKTIFSNTLGDKYSNNVEEIRKILAWQLARPVLFKQQIDRIYQEGARIFVEVGPNAVLSKLADNCLTGKEKTIISIDRQGQNGLASLMNALALLSTRGVEVAYQRLWDGFEEPETGKNKKKSSATVKINGSNHGKLYPPKSGAGVLPKTNPETFTKTINDISKIEHYAINDIEKVLNSAEERKVGVAMSNSDGIKNSSSNRIVTESQKNIYRTGSDNLQDERLKALQLLQQNIFEAQKMYQSALTDSHLRFLQASEEAFRQVGYIGQGYNPTESSGYSNQPIFKEQLLSTSISELVATIEPVIINQPVPTMPVQVSNAFIKDRVAVNEEKMIEPVKETAVDYKKVLLEVVSEKTGYPEDMLDLDMDLETELGIDSIKRVEILSGIANKIPSASNFDSSKLSTKKTLNEILAFYTEDNQMVEDESQKKN